MATSPAAHSVVTAPAPAESRKAGVEGRDPFPYLVAPQWQLSPPPPPLPVFLPSLRNLVLWSCLVCVSCLLWNAVVFFFSVREILLCRIRGSGCGGIAAGSRGRLAGGLMSLFIPAIGWRGDALPNFFPSSSELMFGETILLADFLSIRSLRKIFLIPRCLFLVFDEASRWPLDCSLFFWVVSSQPVDLIRRQGMISVRELHAPGAFTGFCAKLNV